VRSETLTFFFSHSQRRAKQATQAQFILQLVIVGSLLVKWWRGRGEKPKPKPPRDTARG